MDKSVVKKSYVTSSRTRHQLRDFLKGGEFLD